MSWDIENARNFTDGPKSFGGFGHHDARSPSVNQVNDVNSDISWNARIGEMKRGKYRKARRPASSADFNACFQRQPAPS
ncbi:MAG: hypothetical protein AAGG56_08675 [Pseudomonadota bacterium]